MLVCGDNITEEFSLNTILSIQQTNKFAFVVVKAIRNRWSVKNFLWLVWTHFKADWGYNWDNKKLHHQARKIFRNLQRTSVCLLCWNRVDGSRYYPCKAEVLDSQHFPTPPELNVLKKSQTNIIKLSLRLYSSCPLHSWTSLSIDWRSYRLRWLCLRTEFDK